MVSGKESHDHDLWGKCARSKGGEREREREREREIRRLQLTQEMGMASGKVTIMKKRVSHMVLAPTARP